MTDNPKEIKLIDTLFSLLNQAADGGSLDEQQLSYVAYKSSRVTCFSESYLPVLRLLQDYSKH